MAYVNFTSLFSSLCSTVALKIYNFLKTQYTTHMTYVATVRTRAVKILHTRAKHVNKNIPNGCNCWDHDSIVCYFSRLQRIERNETVARKDVRFKLPLNSTQKSVKKKKSGVIDTKSDEMNEN